MKDFMWSFPDNETLEQQYGKSITGMKLTCNYYSDNINHNLIENKVPGLVTLEDNLINSRYYTNLNPESYNMQHLYTDLSQIGSKEQSKAQYVDNALYKLKKRVSFSDNLS